MITAVDMTTWDAEVDAIAARFERKPQPAPKETPVTTDQSIHTISEIQSHAAAQRYALALSTAAAAQERITALEKALEDAEWYRLQAESLASTVTYPDEFASVWHIGTEPPPETIRGLIDLSTGTPWVRDRNPELWCRLGAGSSGVIRHEWPIEDAGPFIALPEAWGLDQIGRTLDRVTADHDEIHRQIAGRDGYHEDGQRFWSRPTLHEATGRVLAALDKDRNELRGRLARLVSDFQATGNSQLGDPTADVWHKAAALILEAIDGREATR